LAVPKPRAATTGGAGLAASPRVPRAGSIQYLESNILETVLFIVLIKRLPLSIRRRPEAGKKIVRLGNVSIELGASAYSFRGIVIQSLAEQGFGSSQLGLSARILLKPPPITPKNSMTIERRGKQST
jgi:hypothetical protein